MNGLNIEQAKEKIINEIEKNNLGTKKTLYRLKDWGISRQRYWGCPIPILYLEDGTIVPVEKDELPVTLPKDVDLNAKGNPLSSHPSWKQTVHKSSGKKAIRETDTLDTFVDSSWYFLRFCAPKNDNSPLDEKQIKHWMPVDQYIGGIEHAILHLLYSRFFTKGVSLCNKNLNLSEPFKNLFTQGMVCHKSFKDEKGNWLYPDEVEKIDTKTFVKKSDKTRVIVGPPESMSKSKKNTIDPEDMVNLYGADAVRWFILSDSPPEKDVQWSNVGVSSSNKFLQKIWNLNISIFNRKINDMNKNDEEKFIKEIDNYVSKIDIAINNFRFNVAIAQFYELYNYFKDKLDTKLDNKVLKESIIKFMKLMIPFTPHLAYECLELLKCDTFNKWPDVNKNLQLEIKFAIQINGKTRDIITINKDTLENEINDIIKDNFKIKKYFENQKVIKTIFVKNKIINYITSKQ